MWNPPPGLLIFLEKLLDPRGFSGFGFGFGFGFDSAASPDIAISPYSLYDLSWIFITRNVMTLDIFKKAQILACRLLPHILYHR